MKTLKTHTSRGAIAIIATALLLSACNSKPSDSDIDASIEKTYGKIPGIKIVSVSRTNGRQLNENTYLVEAKTELIFTNNLRKVLSELESSEDTLENNLTQLRLLGVIAMCGGRISEGTSCTTNDELRLVRTEKGWMKN